MIKRISQLNVVIIEDEFFAAKQLKKEIERHGHKVSRSFYSGSKFLEEENLNFDVAFIDIHLEDEISGLQVAKELNRRRKPFIFLTANKDKSTLLEAAKLNPRAYLNKPFKINDIEAILEILSVSAGTQLRVRGSQGVSYIDTDCIIYLKADDSYTEIVTETGIIVQRKLLKNLLDELPNYFVRVHRSYVVNTKKITAQTSTHLMIDDYRIPLSRGIKLN